MYLIRNTTVGGAIGAGNLPGAIAAFRTVVTPAPGHAGTRHLLGATLLASGKAAAAVPELEHAARLAKSGANAYGPPELQQQFAARVQSSLPL